MFEAVREILPRRAQVSVDVNGGWSAQDAIAMSRWLADRGVDHIEQPLPRGRERQLPALRKKMALPIILDESCRTQEDIPVLAGSCDGINIKLMKCGGPVEALRMIHTAQAHGLRIMIGCYSNSALANTAGAHLGGWADYLDLDSHMNLTDDPFQGASLSRGRLDVSEKPGFGVSYEPPNKA